MSKPAPELLPIGRPRCARCTTRMITAAVSSGPEGFERRDFECLKCGHTETKMVASDPMRIGSFPKPRYFFNVHNVTSRLDEIGEELPDDVTAWKEATIIAGELFKDIDGKFKPGQEWGLEVTDEQRRPLYFITIRAKQFK
jgi:hypothetical protein